MGSRHARLGLLCAYMQRNEDALRESRRAVGLEPENQDHSTAPFTAANLALVYALTGEKDQAIDTDRATPFDSRPDVEARIIHRTSPRPILRLRWEWDSLRSDPRFQKILAGPEPKTVY